MSDIVTGIWALSLFVVVLGCIPYAIWVTYTALKKRWRKLGLQILLPLVFLGLLCGISFFLNREAYQKYLAEIYDTEVKLGAPIFEYDSERAFNGDGYSISVYALPESIRKRFENVDAILLAEFPKRPSYRNHWDAEKWREAPFDPQFTKYLDFALSSSDARNDRGLDRHFNDIRSALKRKRTFYSFFKYDHGDYPGDIDMFVVDLEGGRLYSINHNT